MANVAFMVCADGTKQLVKAVDVAPDDRDNPFFCAGITDIGELCEAPVKLADTIDPEDTYFYSSDRTKGHKPGCSFCRAREVSTVEKMDRSGETITFGGLYNRLNRDKLPRKPKSMGPEEGSDTDIEEESEPNHENPDDCEKKIVTKRRNPRDFRETFELLTSLKTSDQYADGFVFDFIFDERTAEVYRYLQRIPVGRPFIVTLRKTIPQAYGIQLEPDEWLLKDYWGKNCKEFVFVLKTTPEAKEIISNLCNISPAVQIRVWAVFHPHPTLPGVYVSDLVKSHMILAEITEDSN
jgi:hypothetical protein